MNNLLSIVFVQLMLTHTILIRAATVNKPEWENDWKRMGQDSLRHALERIKNDKMAKNVIMFLGDGMGIATVTAGRVYVGQLHGKPGEDWQLTFDKFPDVALCKTYNVNYQVPDSAGTATAYLGGEKTSYGVIGVKQNVARAKCDDMKPENFVQSLLRLSINEGKRGGVVTTTRITHATPAAAYAYAPDRDWEADFQVPESERSKPYCTDIALQLVVNNSDVNVFLGGGRQNFLPNTVADFEYPNVTGRRTDGKNLVEMWKNKMASEKKKASFVWKKDEFDQVNPENTDYLFGLFDTSHMKYGLNRAQGGDGEAGEPTLAEMTVKAIKILQKEQKGYFLLVEGGRIDHAHHDNLGKQALHELKEFDDAIEQTLSMVDLDNTLVVVTADHSHAFTMGGYPVRGNPILGLVDPVGFKEQPSLDGLPYLTLMYANGPSATNQTFRVDLSNVDTKSKDFLQASHVPLSAETHGGEDVAVYATGPMSHLFHGVQEQHYIAHVMAYASCVGENKEHCEKNSAANYKNISWKLLLVALCYLRFMSF